MNVVRPCNKCTQKKTCDLYRQIREGEGFGVFQIDELVSASRFASCRQCHVSAGVAVADLSCDYFEERKIEKIPPSHRQWYKMTSFFDTPAQVVTELDKEAKVLLQGVLYEANVPCQECGATVHLDKIRLTKDGRVNLSPQLGLCIVPPAISQEKGEALRRMLEANLRMPVLVMSNNVQMVRLEPASQAEVADTLDEKDKEGGELISFPGGCDVETSKDN